MATHSSILAWRIPGTGEPGGLTYFFFIPGLGSSPGEGIGSPLQYSCLENPMDTAAWRSTVHGGHKESDMIEHARIYCYEHSESCCLVQTLCNRMDCILPGSSVHGIFQARILGWAAMPFSRGSSQPRDRTWVSNFAGRFFTI